MRAFVTTPATLAHRFTVVPAGAVTATFTRHDGTVAHTGPATVDAATGVATIDVPASAFPDVDLLTGRWEAAGGHVETDEVSVDLRPYVSVADLGEADEIVAGAVLEQVERRIEKHCKVAFTPRYAVDHTVGRGLAAVPLSWPLIREVRQVLVDDVPIDPADVDVRSFGLARRHGSFVTGQPLEVGYVHGHQAPPADLADAARDAAVQLLHEAKSRHSVKRAQFAEGASWLIATASPAHGRLFGIPTIDSVIELHREQQAVVA